MDASSSSRPAANIWAYILLLFANRSKQTIPITFYLGT